MLRLTITLALVGCALAGVIHPLLSDDIEGRIVGGSPAAAGAYPYQVALLKGGSLFCGGSLIALNKVVTAAHCLQTYTADQIQVRAGSLHYASGGQVINVKKFKNHEDYDSKKYINDVAVILLEESFKTDDNIAIIGLAESAPATGTTAVVTGWGTDKFLVGSVQSDLLYAIVEIIAEKDCASSTYSYGSSILPTMICAADKDFTKDACQGDSGGPLAAGGKLVGIVSWGNRCARTDYPGVYSSVAELRSWIVATANAL